MFKHTLVLIKSGFKKKQNRIFNFNYKYDI